MAVRKSDRLVPSLIHVFRVSHERRDAKDAGPTIREDGKNVVVRIDARRETVSEAQLIEIVRDDLVSLLNTTCLGSAEDLSDAPQVQRSVLNYGFPDLAKRTIDENRLAELADEIETALADFEPRLVRGTIKARRDANVKATELKLRFIVGAELRAHPIDVPMEFIAEVELNSGKIKIDRL